MKTGRFDHKRGPHQRHSSHRERAEQAASALKRQLELRSRKLAERAAKTEAERAASAARPARSAAYRTALRQFRSLAGEPARYRSANLISARRHAVRCIDGNTRPVLCWPEFEASPAAIAAKCLPTNSDNRAWTKYCRRVPAPERMDTKATPVAGQIQTPWLACQISRSNAADDPANARFTCSGKGLRQRPASLKLLHKRLDIVLFDLSQTGRNRLGRDFRRVAFSPFLPNSIVC
jgi:hypothetical protein